jgi:predicted nucleic acid-binding protein
MQRYRRLVTVVAPAPIPTTVQADPDDDHVLACALAARADLIVSGDRHLLDLGMYRSIRIVTSADALSALAQD